MFRALASFFQSSAIDHILLRKMLIHYIYQNADAFRTDILAEGYRSLEDYCAYMSVPGHWGDGVCLQCFSILFKVNVWVSYHGTDEENMPSCISNYQQNAPNLALLLTNNHYDRILSW